MPISSKGSRALKSHVRAIFRAGSAAILTAALCWTTSCFASTSHEKPFKAEVHEKLGTSTAILDGTWQGQLGVLKGPELTDTGQPLTVRLTIHNNIVHVFIGDTASLEVKPGLFKIERMGTNAIIFATNSDKDNEGTWIETWSFIVTQKDQNTLLTIFSRVVNNVDLPTTNDHSKFIKGNAGQLKKI